MLIDEGTPRALTLETRVSNFYRTVGTRYPAFNETSRRDRFWRMVVNSIETRLADRPYVKVAELGAGRTGFADFLGPLRSRVEFHAHDVTDTNRTHLEGVADRTHIGAVTAVADAAPFDVVFSTFVYEHVVRPREFIDAQLSMIESGGSIFIFSPRYDWAGYIPPSLRHMPTSVMIWNAMKVWTAHWRSAVSNTPRFLLVEDPAMFHTEDWHRDADAIHLASLADLRAYLKGRPATIHQCVPVGTPPKVRITDRLLKLCVRIDKTG